LNGLYTLKGLNASGPQAGMTRSAHHRLDRRQESFTLSFSTHDQVENDVKDTVYQTAGIAYPVIPAPDQVEGDVKDMIYQLRESPTLSFPIHRESPFFKDGIPNQVGNDSFVIFIVILTHIIRY